ncbi:MAG: hypothetical protein AB7P31_15075 [Steroidobacteraceae bacterium]
MHDILIADANVRKASAMRLEAAFPAASAEVATVAPHPGWRRPSTLESC